MRDILAKEIGIYTRLARLDTVVHPTLTTGMPPKSSIDRLTEHFIVGLEEEFPATVSTVVRTAFKIKTAHKNKDVCPLCEGPVDTIDTTALIVYGPPAEPAAASAERMEPTQQQHDAPIDLGPLLCYACRNITHNIKQRMRATAATAVTAATATGEPWARETILPGYVARHAALRVSRDRMRDQISEFLIDSGGEDDDDDHAAGGASHAP
ncbi:Cytoplasmic tRNA 2-thiolation protein 2 [Polyrhizophydium stewartii]|uniref:Cytoplasmic tRNA 2-thiolation protein 2 n=1 Tax=Polyrhizophydium stewartii TaxID=2732419 RepID=A0ABR4N934_9FUNG